MASDRKQPWQALTSQNGSAAGLPRGAPGGHADPGAAFWDFLASFVAARSTFLSLYRLYERRVLKASRRMGVSRDVLLLPPADLFRLFHLGRMQLLRDARLRPLRELASQAFAESEDEELLDVYCSHIYHEFTILSEEHRSVGRFVHIHDTRRYRQLFEEVSGYYPMRLRRIRRLFTGGMRRIELLLPQWTRHRVMIRSAYLFGDRLARKAYGSGLETLYRKMYPQGGAVVGYLRAAESFRESGFWTRALSAAKRAVRAAEHLEERRALEPVEADALEAARTLLPVLQREMEEASDAA